MTPLKSLGPNAFNACFYQSYLHIVGKEICAAALKFLNGGNFDSCINFTYITLIPKIKNPTCANEFRPIRLCNVFYKIVFKALANMLKKKNPFSYHIQ